MGPNLDTPGTYRIRVKGYLDSSWSDRLGGLTITPTGQGHEPVETTLYGQVLDQAALAGVLSALYDLHLSLLSVEYLGDLKDGAPPAEQVPEVPDEEQNDK
jgi:hypothetical protein